MCIKSSRFVKGHKCLSEKSWFKKGNKVGIDHWFVKGRKRGYKVAGSYQFPKGHQINKGRKRGDSWNKGKHPEYMQGKNHWNWQGGKALRGYPPTFTQQLKDRVRVRDSFICQDCGVPELECGERLLIHHKDRDKSNSNIDNLVALCRNCHNKYHNRRQKLVQSESI